MTTCATITYSLTVICAKLSMLCLLLRLSPEGTFRYIVIAVMLIILGYTIAYELVSIFSCTPIRAAWDIAITDARCVDKNAVYMALGVANILMDVVILFLPLRVVAPLQMPLRQKTCLIALFTTGAFVCGCAIQRTVMLPPIMSSADYTWDIVDQFVWSFLEAKAGIVCVSVPTLKPFFAHYVPVLIGSKNDLGGASSDNAYPLFTVYENNRKRREARCHERGSVMRYGDEQALWCPDKHPKVASITGTKQCGTHSVDSGEQALHEPQICVTRETNVSYGSSSDAT